jgi:hypothetical protein
VSKSPTQLEIAIGLDVSKSPTNFIVVKCYLVEFPEFGFGRFIAGTLRRKFCYLLLLGSWSVGRAVHSCCLVATGMSSSEDFASISTSSGSSVSTFEEVVAVGYYARVQEEINIERWARLIRKAQRLRRLQRIFGYLGQFLQTFPTPLLRRLQRTWKKQ